MSRTIYKTPFFILTFVVLIIGHQLYGADVVDIGIVLDNVIRDVGAPLTLGGLLATLYGLGQVFGSNSAGWILKNRGPKITFCLGLSLFSFFTFLTGLAITYWDAAIYRVSFGFGQGIWNVAYYAIIAILFTERKGFANAIFGIMYPLGLLWGAPATALIFVWSGNWRMPFYIFGVAGFLILFVFILGVKSTTLERSKDGTANGTRDYWSILKIRNVVLACTYGVLYAIMISSILALYPTYLRTVLGFDPVSTGLIISMQTWAWVAVSPIFLLLSDRYGRKWFLFFFAIFSAFAVYLIFNIPIGDFTFATVANIFYGTAGAGTFTMIILLAQDTVSSTKMSVTTGFVVSFIYIGVTISGPLTGYIVSIIGWTVASYWIIGCCIVSSIVALLAREKRINGRLKIN